MELQDKIFAAAEYIRSKTTLQPKVGLVLGSGLGDFADTLTEAVRIPFCDIRNFPQPTVEGHSGALVIGISCITNMAAGVLPRKLCHEEVIETAAKAHDDFQNLLGGILSVL